MVGQPAGGNGEGAEGDEAAERERQEVGIRPIPLARQRDHHRRKHQHNEVIEQVAEVQERHEPAVVVHDSKLNRKIFACTA